MRLLGKNFVIVLMMLVACLGSAQSADLGWYLDEELPALQAQKARESSHLNAEYKALAAELAAHDKRVQELTAANEKLRQNKSIFNRNASKIEKNAAQLSQLARESEVLKTRLQQKGQALRSARDWSRALEQELAARKRQEAQRLTKNLEAYDQAQLQAAEDNYEAILAREHSQLRRFEVELKKHGSQFDQTSLTLQNRINALRKRAEATGFTLVTIRGEIAGRQADQSLEREQISAHREKKHEASGAAKDAGKSAHGQPSIFETFEHKKEALEAEIAERKRQDEARMKIYIGAALAFALLAFFFVKRTLISPPASAARRRRR